MTRPLPKTSALPATPVGQRAGDGDLQFLADQLLNAFSAVRRNARRHAVRPAELAPLTGAQLELVRLLRRHPGLSVARAAAELRLAPNTVSTLVGQLVEAAIVTRTADESDRRVARLELTPDIRRKVSAWRDRRVVALADAMTRLSADDQRRLDQAEAALVRLAKSLETGGR